MSLGTFLSGLWNAVKNLFHSLPEYAKEGVAIGNKVVDNIKNFEGELTLLTDVIPGDIDDKVVAAIEKCLPIIVTDLQLATDLKGETDPVKIVNAAMSILKSLGGKTVQYDFYDSLAVQIGMTATSVLSNGAEIWKDGKALWNDIKSVMKWFHDHHQSPLPA